MADTIGYVHSLESFGLVDGPGVRFVVFLQGCNLRCKFCHNPETWSCKGKNVEEWTAEKLFERIYRYRKYWAKNGGITVSGGEPLLQMDFMIELFEIAKKHNVHTAIDTAGQPFDDNNPEWMDKFKKLMSMTDLVILDLKEMDPEKHKSLTGFDNANILKWQGGFQITERKCGFVMFSFLVLLTTRQVLRKCISLFQSLIQLIG